MHITAPAADWLAALDRVSPAYGRRAAVPVLAGVHIEDNGSGAALTGFDFEVSAVTSIVCKCCGDETASVQTTLEESDVLVIEHHSLTDTIKRLAGKNKRLLVSVESDPNEPNLTTVSARGYRIPVYAFPADEYPPVPEATASVSVDRAAFVAAMNRAAVTASKDETLPILASVRLIVDVDSVTFMSTDRYRITTERVVAAVTPNFKPFEAIVPVKEWKRISRKLTGDRVGLGTHTPDRASDPGRLGLYAGGTAYTLMTTDGDYPKLETLLATWSPTAIRVDRAALLETVRMAQSLAPRNVPIRVDFDGFGADAYAMFDLGNREVRNTAPIAPGRVVAGDEHPNLTVGFNPAYLVDALEAFTTDDVVFRLDVDHGAKSILITEGDAEPGDGSRLRVVLMPVRVGPYDPRQG